MNLPISQRLLACAQFISPGDTVADVGCDHGYLGIHLLQRGIARFILASDLREGPLQSARDNALKYGVADRMAFFRSDGLQNVPRDFDTLVCAGMGAETMISILEAAPWVRSSRYRLILQCQIKTHLLRRYLSETGFAITEEQVLRDGKFRYTVMEAVWKPAVPRLTPGQWYVSPPMLEIPTPEVGEHFWWILKELDKIVTSRGSQAEPWMQEALSELRELPESHPFLKEENYDNCF